jgi:hypothetical protein
MFFDGDFFFGGGGDGGGVGVGVFLAVVHHLYLYSEFELIHRLLDKTLHKYDLFAIFQPCSC